MTDQIPVSDLMATALATAQDAETRAHQATTPAETRAAAETIEHTAIDIMSVFEARMQHHFKRGPFSKELQKRLTSEGEDALAQTFIQYAHAVNVLKHGHGKSHRALLGMKGLPFAVRRQDRDDTNIGLVDVLSPGFAEGLIDTLKQAHAFLKR